MQLDREEEWRNKPEHEIAQERRLSERGRLSRERMVDGRVSRDLGRREG